LVGRLLELSEKNLAGIRGRGEEDIAGEDGVRGG
jgi:hypothetical protein